MVTVSAAATTAYAAASFRLRPSIVLFGDSITEFGFGRTNDSSDVGWASLLASSYTRRCDVLNRGFSGYNTRHALDVIPRVFGNVVATTTTDTGVSANPHLPADAPTRANHQHELLFCTVFFGANDGAALGEPQHVPIEEYGTNLDQIVQEIRQRSVSNVVVPIILLTPPPVDEIAWAKRQQTATSDRANDRIRLYGAKVKQVAAAHEQCAIVDTWQLLQGDSADRSRYLCDGVHLNEEGNRIVFSGLMDVLQTQFPHLAPMSDEDGDGRYGTVGVPKEEKLWKQLC